PKKFEKGFRTGGIVQAIIPSGKYQGFHTGRVAIRFGQNFQIGKVSSIPATASRSIVPTGTNIRSAKRLLPMEFTRLLANA
ncbi:MAG: hypothetical protein WB773_24170, partial [Isosphaeraceae bacterium]